MSIESLRFEELSFGYHPDKTLINKASFNFPLNGVVWLEGDTGAGKTVIFKLIMGLVNPTGGDILINGESVNSMSFPEFQRYRLRMGYGFETGGLLMNRTLRDNLTLPLLFHKHCGVDEAIERAMQYLAVFGIESDAASLPAMVSGSKRKCAALARALIHRPELLLLDDPVTGLSEKQIENLGNLLHHHRELFGLRHLFFTSRRPKFAKMLKAKGVFLTNQSLVLQDKPQNPGPKNESQI